MPDVTYTPLDESVDFDAASLNTRFDGVTNAINALQEDAVAPKAFNSTHLPTLLLAEDHDWAHRTSAGTYAEASGWADINDGADLVVDLGGTYTPANSGPVGLIHVKFSAIAQQVGVASPSAASGYRFWVGFRIQSSVTGGVGTYADIGKTVRWVGSRDIDYVGSAQINQNVDVSISTFLDSSDLPSGARYFKAQVWCYDQAASGSSAQAEIFRCQLAAFVLRSQRS